MFQQRYPPYDTHLTTFYSDHAGFYNHRRLSPVLEAVTSSYHSTTVVDGYPPLPPTAPTPAHVPFDVSDDDYYGGIPQETSVDSRFLFTPTAIGFQFNDDTQQYHVPTPHVVETDEFVYSFPQEQVGSVPAQVTDLVDSQSQEQISLPTPEPSPKLQTWPIDAPHPSPLTEDPVLEVIFRGRRDKERERDLSYLALNLEDPGHTTMAFEPPLTGIAAVDEASRQYYSFTPADTELRRFGGEVGYQYPLEVIQALQETLVTDWANCQTRNTIWASVLERGVDKDYRPLATDPKTRQRLQVVYTPHSSSCPNSQLTSSSNFQDYPIKVSAKPLVNYFGTFVMQYMDNMYMQQKAWNDIAEEIKDHLYDQAPHLFKGFKPYKTVPRIPVVRFIYTKFDEAQLARAVAQLERDRTEGIESDSCYDLESDVEVDGDYIIGNDSLFLNLDGE
ncbi:hypothetical protein BKA82DRAFT_1009241 [Pisolithus tinctorius]|nr:hypothetical protein BKA82DRAFT_1009241 [Pisolithus tinctorius]